MQNGKATLENSLIFFLIKQMQQLYFLVFNQIYIYIYIYLHEKSAKDVIIHDLQNLKETKMPSSNG